MVGGSDPEALSAAPEAERERLAVTIVAVDHHGSSAAERVAQVVGKRLADPALSQFRRKIPAAASVRYWARRRQGRLGIDRLHCQRHGAERGPMTASASAVRDATRRIACAFEVPWSSMMVRSTGGALRAGLLDAHSDAFEHLGADIRGRAGESERDGDTHGVAHPRPPRRGRRRGTGWPRTGGARIGRSSTVGTPDKGMGGGMAYGRSGQTQPSEVSDLTLKMSCGQLFPDGSWAARPRFVATCGAAFASGAAQHAGS